VGCSGGRARDLPHPKKRVKIFLGNCHVKFGHFVNFSYIYLMDSLVIGKSVTIVVTLGLHTGCIGGISITRIFGNFYTSGGDF